MEPLKIYNLLFESFGPQGWWPVKGKNPRFEIILGAILTQNTSWNNVESVLDNLREKGLIEEEALREKPEKELAELIRPSGYFNQKARKIKAFLDFRGEISRENLLGIWGIGPETADSILLYAYNKPYFVIDAYTKRIFERLGLGEMDYKGLQDFFHKNLPRDIKIYKEFHALIVKLGKEFCRKKPLCEPCPLSRTCLINIYKV